MSDFQQDLTEKVSKVLGDDDKVKMIQEAATTYIGWNNVASGREFFEKVILASPKDYPTDDMRFYQALTELKSRLGRIYDETISLK